MSKVLVVNQPRCVGCHTCELECAMAHSELGTLAEVITAESPPRRRVTVEPVSCGSMPMQCRHCAEAACVLICPKQALSRDSAELAYKLSAQTWCSNYDACSMMLLMIDGEDRCEKFEQRMIMLDVK